MRFKFLWLLLVLTVATSSVYGRGGVKVGIDVLAASGFKGLEGKRIGLITNQSGISSTGKSSIDILRNASGLHLVALYAPEHGLYGSDLAGAYVESTIDKASGLKVYSLYGPTRKPTPDMLKGIDVLVYDIQDIGCRSYTFISTLGLAMEAAGEAGIEFYVLDRPNPLNGNRVEGMPLDPKFRSFVGQWDIPYVYGMTPGELARMICGEKWITKRPKLTIVPMKGWQRWYYWEDTDLIWVPTSPHIPTPESAMDYVVTGLVGEIGRINNGIGYTIPFGMLGLPEFDENKLSQQLNALTLPGIYFRPASYKPFYGSLQGQLCHGVQIHFINRTRANLANLCILLIEKMQQIVGANFFTRANADQIAMFDKVSGGDAVRKHLSAHLPASELISSWQASLAEFRRKREPYLIYGGHEKNSGPSVKSASESHSS